MNRRTFLTTSLASAAALSTFASGFAKPPGSEKARKKVVVAGAGLAGLVAAYELVKAGHDVTILEANTRPGGRVHTLRDPFPDQLYAEAGAVDFGDGYHNLLHYIGLFGISVQEIPFGKEVVSIRNKRVVLDGKSTPDWPLDLTAEERTLGRDGLYRQHLGPAIQDIGDSSRANWLSAAAQYDGFTIHDYLRRAGLSHDAVQLASMSINGEDYDHLSAAQSLALEWFYSSSNKVLTMKGGNDQLPKAFARALESQLHYGAAVIGVSQTDSHARVSFMCGSARQQIESDHVVLAIPFSVLRHIELDSSVSPPKREAINNMRYESVVRQYLVFRRRFWSERGESGTACTDSDIGLVVDHTSSQSGTRGILEAQMEGAKGRRALSMTAEQRMQWTAQAMDKVHPGALANLEGGTTFAWDEENLYARGGWAFYAPGELSRFLPHVGTAEGRIHFAGEHTSPLAMTLEGAVESGLRAAGEI